MAITRYLWEPGRLGKILLPHRVVMGAMHLGLEDADPSGEALAAFYRERAVGGAGLIVTGGVAVSRVGAGGKSYSVISDPRHADALAKIPEAVHPEDTRVFLQLFHAGRYAREDAFGLTPVAPSAVYSNYSRCEPHALRDEEIEQTIEDFARATVTAGELGFDGVEIMGSEGYLLSQFMAPLTNLRDDQWGGDARRRMRFPLAVSEAVRAACKPRMAVVYRISGADLLEGGAPLAEVLALAGELADGPVDALNVGVGWHESRVPTVQSAVPKAAWAPWVRAVRQRVGETPVILSNRVNTAALADALIAEGYADFISMARPFLADPRFVARNRAAPRSQQINVCIACNQCIDQSIFDQRVSCAVNPRAGYEHQEGQTPVDGGHERVAVIGGGPAGMEAARSLAVSGFDVTLFEAAPELGGQFRMARRIPGKADFGQTGVYFAAELARLGVSIKLGVSVELEPPPRGAGGRVRKLRGGRHQLPKVLAGFTAVVVATGVLPRHVQLPGAELPHVLSYAELLLADAPFLLVGKRVAIIGAGGIGTDVAHLLGEQRGFYERYGLTPPGRPLPPLPDAVAGPWQHEPAMRRRRWPGVHHPDAPEDSERPLQITLMRRHGRIGDGVGPSTRWVVVQELRRAGVEMLTDVEYTRIEPDAVLVQVDGHERRIPADTVVIAAGQEPHAPLVAALKEARRPHVVIGGAAGTAGLDAGRAFRDGYNVPRALAQVLAPA